ncbi:cyclophane-forming radical SAM/SPASM peptide maturase YhhB [Bradyrhizobium macuxiense]|uniref:cyclophane-forming radical SAM/SPASM peptide maturase YhhB n=1 Tax=Bradyrhizobium macuxiense TaxID=1755647 RepID=UPI001FEECFF5|nr:cyclophane-forming radical SAM/SPASM peptide maturase YhhB [Bradyrhizobium macuxiense]
MGARFTSFLVKVASRCNLDCEYCYVYHHADQSWRSLPRLLSGDNQAEFVCRLAEYAKEVELEHCLVIFHGGEPLLLGASELSAFAKAIRAALEPATRVDFGLQTNGLLLTEDAIDILKSENIAISLSLDGPREVNDRHRVTRKGRSSFVRTMKALKLLNEHRSIFAGVIAVIDPHFAPSELLAFFAEHKVPRLDFLLPDANHLRQPPFREQDPDIFSAWLKQAFDTWFDEYSTLPIRTFDALLDAAAGLPSRTDAFGLGDVSLLTIETDGSYHDLDVLKITRDGATSLGEDLANTSVAAIAASPAIEAHRGLLRKEGLSDTCQKCVEVDICGGGSLPHRYGSNGFRNPTVYCGEMQSLIAHIRQRLAKALGSSEGERRDIGLPSFSLEEFELAETSPACVSGLVDSAGAAQSRELSDLVERLRADSLIDEEVATKFRMLDEQEVRKVSLRPATVAWTRAMWAAIAKRPVFSVDGSPLTPTAGELVGFLTSSESGIEIAQDDEWLRKPFGTAIAFEPPDVSLNAQALVDHALAIIHQWRPAIATEIVSICRSIQLVRDPGAHPDKIVSFSDNTVPGALYVSVTKAEGFIDAYDLADSLVHEYRHQKLYLLERLFPMVQPNSLKVVSPWRQDLRPPSGLLHAIFVFVELRRFWQHVRDRGPARLHNRAINQLADTDRHLAVGMETLMGCPLTEAGRTLAQVLDRARVT